MSVELKQLRKIGEDNTAFEKETSEEEAGNSHNPGPKLTNGDGIYENSHALEAQVIAKSNDDEEQPGRRNPCCNVVQKAQTVSSDFVNTHKTFLTRIFGAVCLILYLCYFGYAMYYRFGDEGSIRLLVLTIFIIYLIVLNILTPWTDPLLDQFQKKLFSEKHVRKHQYVRWFLYAALAIVVIVVIITEVALKDPRNLASGAGLLAFLLICFVFSVNPARINWHPVVWGMGLQFIFALLILKTRPGYDAFFWLGERVNEFLLHTDAGSIFVFGDVYMEHFFAFKVLPVIIFFSTMISVLYYLGAMQAVIRVIGRFLSFCLDTTPAESLNAAGNIFVGMTEAPLLIRPFLEQMTMSELHAVMTGGFATIAGSVLGAYVGFGVPANHLLSASVMSAPAALAISKLMYPEVEKPRIKPDDYKKMENSSERNVIEAAYNGAAMAVPLVANVAANVLAFLAILAFIDATLAWFGARVGVYGLNFQLICSYLLYPVALFMGTSLDECRNLARLVGIKTFTNEFIAYSELKKLIDNNKAFSNYTATFGNASSWHWEGDDVILEHWNTTLFYGILSERSVILATYALCGFSNFGSMGILLGGLVSLAPSRKTDMATIVFRAMIAGNIACFATACIAGLFIDASS